MKEFKILLFVIEKDFSQSKDIEMYLTSTDSEAVEQYLKDTIKKDYHITQIEIIHR